MPKVTTQLTNNSYSICTYNGGVNELVNCQISYHDTFPLWSTTVSSAELTSTIPEKMGNSAVQIEEGFKFIESPIGDTFDVFVSGTIIDNKNEHSLQDFLVATFKKTK